MPTDVAQRASPDALLALVSKESRGHLKIFLGAAPGVGKTYAMLTSAQTERAGGRDVVAGLVETHGRRETEALLHGFEVLPRKAVVYQNRILHEFDLDGAISRRPSLLLVDEYAHTNVPGSRHPKRWQDVEEILSAGIDVWTTLNIQHLESLNDVIQKITHVRVRETVPDRVFEEADEIVLVDFPPDELLKRLAEGKVYVQDTAARAVENFFKPQNLTALRELALRRAAERIDADLVERMQAQAIEGPWAAGERILACIGPDPTAPMIVRTAKRLADLMDAPWIVVTVERPALQLSEARRRLVDEALKLARELGADTKTLVGTDLPTELLRFARFENVTQIVIGRARAAGVTAWLRRSLAQELIQSADDIAIHIVTGTAPQEKRRFWLPTFKVPETLETLAFFWSTILVALATVVGRILVELTPFPNVASIFQLAILIAAIRYGIWPAVFASVAGFVSYNFFFVEPLYTFAIERTHEFFTLTIFLFVAISVSMLAGRVRETARFAVVRMRAARRLYEFTRKLSGLATVDEICDGAASETHASLARPTVVMLDEEGELNMHAAWPPEDELDTASMSAARWAVSHDEPAGAGTATLPTVPWLFLPLRTPRSRVGVIGIRVDEQNPDLDAEGNALFETLAEQTAAALERALLAKEMVSARAQAETERVRNTLLASISHDFRTPLAAILGSATTLLEMSSRLSEPANRDLLVHIRDDTEHLDEMVRNLLAITRIDSGGLELKLDWVDLREIVARVIAAARRRGATHWFENKLPTDLPLVRADATLIEQAIGNVVANIVAHTPSDTRATIDALACGEAITIRVTDTGPGIPPEMLPRVFDKFVRARPTDTTSDGGRGTGLGLAIVKGIMEAHGGSVAAESPVDGWRGTRFLLTLPATKP